MVVYHSNREVTTLVFDTFELIHMNSLKDHNPFVFSVM